MIHPVTKANPIPVKKNAESKSGAASEKILRLEGKMQTLRELLWQESGQDIAEYAVMLAVILVIVVGTIRLVGSNANNVFSNVASSIQ